MAYYLNKEAFYAIEGVGILACFVGVLMIAMSGSKHEDNPDTLEVVDDAFLGGGRSSMRAVGIVCMLFVALNDASLNVLSRKMKDLHYSLIQFWFSLIGLFIMVVYLLIASIVTLDWPQMFYYNWDQL